MGERWPPVYEASQLKDTIESLASMTGTKGIYGPKDVAGPFCQGDILSLGAELPFLNEEGEAEVLEPSYDHWLVVGNTCDFSRPVEEVPWTQLVPIVETQDLREVPVETRRAFTSYQYSRRFYVPPWPGSTLKLRYADLLTPVAIEKARLGEVAEVAARMNREGWILLHSCLVRFLCRDDGRFD